MEQAAPDPTHVFDLTELLARSLGQRKPAPKAGSAKKAARKRAWPMAGPQPHRGPGPAALPEAAQRMAVRTEDHPVSYNAFEGTIPPGQYGAGTVLVWDRGPGSRWATRTRAWPPASWPLRCTAKRCRACGSCSARPDSVAHPPAAPARPAALPRTLAPQLATLADRGGHDWSARLPGLAGRRDRGDGQGRRAALSSSTPRH